MAKFPRLSNHINTAFPNDVCPIATVLPSGYAQVTPRGSTLYSTTGISRYGNGQGFDDGNRRWQEGYDLL